MSTANRPEPLKSAKKKKAKTEAPVVNTDSASHASDPPQPSTSTAAATNGSESIIESHPYIKELIRQTRNLHKKISASSKADSVVADNPGVDLDTLVTQKKLNADQKAQLVKKPQLQAQLNQLEEQLNQYRSFAQELEERFSREKAILVQEHEAEIAQRKEEADAKAQEHGAQSKDLEKGLKIVSDFLHAAASKRNELDESVAERQAFEGALLLIYQGNEASLLTLHNLIDGTDDKVPDTDGTLVDFTYAQLKGASLAETTDSTQPTSEPIEAPVVDETPSDPTIANAGMTELEDTTVIPIRSNGVSGEEGEAMSAPVQVSTASEAANAIAEASWNPEASITTDASGTGEEWVQVPRDPAETETGTAATPAAAPNNESSWAEEVATSAEEQKKENDGFEPVRGRHGDNRGRVRGGRGRGDLRGRGRGGPGRGGLEGRGRGGGSGRGRGGPRPDRG